MKVVSFNVNSIRSRLHQLAALVEQHNPDIIGLQEVKVTDQDFPYDDIKSLGYHVATFGQKTHYGVALLSKHTPTDVRRGFPTDSDDAQRRLIEASYTLANGQSLRVINGYFPQGESRDHPIKFPGKEKFYADLQQHLCTSSQPDQHLIVMGDFNVARADIDIGIGADNQARWIRTGKASFLPEERAWLEALFDWGLFDTYRLKHQDQADCYSWFDYRSRGFEQNPKRGLRIDLLLATKSMSEQLIAAGIDYPIRAMEKPSDHCPIWAEFALQ